MKALMKASQLSSMIKSTGINSTYTGALSEYGDYHAPAMLEPGNAFIRRRPSTQLTDATETQIPFPGQPSSGT